MQRIAAFFLTLLLALPSKAQFSITPTGIRSNDSLGYYVVPVPGISAENIYNSVSAFLLANCGSDNLSMTGLTSETLIANIRSPHAFLYHKLLWQNTYADVEICMSFRFKEGKLRIDPPIVKDMSYLYSDAEHPERKERAHFFISAPDWITQVKQKCMFDHNGKIVNKRAVENFEIWLNALVNDIVVHVKKNQADDW